MIVGNVAILPTQKICNTEETAICIMREGERRSKGKEEGANVVKGDAARRVHSRKSCRKVRCRQRMGLGGIRRRGVASVN